MSIPYTVDDEEAVARLRALSDYWSAKHGVNSTWDGAVGRLAGKKMGVKYDGTVRIGDGSVAIEVEAGWLADKLGAPAYVERKVKDYLDPANTLESLRARIPK